MDLAAGSSADSVVKAGNEFSDKATSVNDSIKETLGDMADSFTSPTFTEHDDILRGKYFDELDPVDICLAGARNWRQRGHFLEPPHRSRLLLPS